MIMRCCDSLQSLCKHRAASILVYWNIHLESSIPCVVTSLMNRFNANKLTRICLLSGKELVDGSNLDCGFRNSLRADELEVG